MLILVFIGRAQEEYKNRSERHLHCANGTWTVSKKLGMAVGAFERKMLLRMCRTTDSGEAAVTLK